LVRSNVAYFSLILAGVRGCGRVAPVTFPDSSTAEQSTVNRQVLGSNPSQGAI
jgi:predicted small lipoprotein YifL